MPTKKARRTIRETITWMQKLSDADRYDILFELRSAFCMGCGRPFEPGQTVCPRHVGGHTVLRKSGNESDTAGRIL
jgi:RNase P subunit RPR2